MCSAFSHADRGQQAPNPERARRRDRLLASNIAVASSGGGDDDVRERDSIKLGSKRPPLLAYARPGQAGARSAPLPSARAVRSRARAN